MAFTLRNNVIVGKVHMQKISEYVKKKKSKRNKFDEKHTQKLAPIKQILFHHH